MGAVTHLAKTKLFALLAVLLTLAIVGFVPSQGHAAEVGPDSQDSQIAAGQIADNGRLARGDLPDGYRLTDIWADEAVDTASHQADPADGGFSPNGDDADGALPEAAQSAKGSRGLSVQEDSEKFLKSGQWRYRIEDSGVAIVGYDAEEGEQVDELRIPDTLEGKNVVALDFDESYIEDRNAIWGNASRIVLGSNVTAIGSYTFAYCAHLKSVDTSVAPLTSLGLYPFVDTGITSFTMPETLVEINELAFDGMYELRDLYLSSSFEPLYSDAPISAGEDTWQGDQYDNPAPRSPNVVFHVPENSKYYQVIDGVLYSKDGTVLYSRPIEQDGTAFEVPSGVRYVADYAMFGAEKLTKVTFNEGLRSIGQDAFALSGLTDVVIPGSVRTIRDWAFCNCPQLKSVYINEGLVDLWDQGCMGQFSMCPKLVSIHLPETLTRIGNTVFNETGITEVDIPAKVTQINYGAFGDCPSLAKVTGCEGLKHLSNQAFCNTAISSFPFGKKLMFVSGNTFEGCSKYPRPAYPSYLTRNGVGDYLLYAGPVYVSGTERYDLAFKVLSLVNSERKAKGLKALTMDADLLPAAMQRASELSVLFEHERPSGEECYTASSKMHGENIAAHQAMPAAVMESWMNSPDHRNNILNSDFVSIGIGCYVCGGTYYWVQTFGYDAANKVGTQPSNTTATHAVYLRSSARQISFSMSSSVSKGVVGKTAQMSVRSNEEWSSGKLLAKSFTWSSSDTKLATVDAKGKVTFKYPGTVTIKAKIARVSKVITRKISIGKGAQPLVLKSAKSVVRLSAKTLRSKPLVIKKPVLATKAQGVLSYKNACTKKVTKGFKVDAKTGNITVPKNTKPGTYAFKVKATAKGNAKYLAGSKAVTFKIVVK